MCKHKLMIIRVFMDKLYAPWRDKYVEDSVKGQRPDAQKTCVFCEVFAENILMWAPPCKSPDVDHLLVDACISYPPW